MKRVTYSAIDLNTTDAGNFIQELGICPRKSAPKIFESDDWTYYFDIPSEKIEKYMVLFKQYKGDYPKFLREECVFSKVEIDNAELLVVQITSAPIDRTVDQEDREYDLHSIKNKKFRSPWKFQIKPLVASRSSLSRKSAGICLTYNFEILWHEIIANKISAICNNITRIAVNDVVDKSSGDILDWRQPFSYDTPPFFNEHTTGLAMSDTQPSTKKYVAVYHTSGVGFYPVYCREQIVNLFGGVPDILFTSELLGDWPVCNSGPVILPQPMFIISQKIRNLLINEKVKGIKYIPVSFIK